MKIAFIGQKGLPAQQGGIERHVEELGANLAKAGLEVFAYNRPHYAPRVDSYRGIKIINLPSINTKHLDAISHTLFATVHALFQNYDIIHYHGVGPALLSWIPRMLAPQTKIVATFHCIDRKHQKWNRFARLTLAWGERAACRFPHRTIAVSQTLKKYCDYRFDRETIYIPNGVAVVAKEKKSGQKFLTTKGLKKNGYFLAVSRLVQHKGLHTLIAAYQQLDTDKKLVIVGNGANTGDYVNRLRKLAGNNPKIIFTGQQTGNNLRVLFANAYAFIQPSEAEGLSIALLEAMAYGLPVIISDIEENREVAGAGALEFAVRNADSLAQKMKFAETHSRLIKLRANNSCRQINRNYNWTRITAETIRLYKQLAEQKSANWAGVLIGNR